MKPTPTPNTQQTKTHITKALYNNNIKNNTQNQTKQQEKHNPETRTNKPTN